MGVCRGFRGGFSLVPRELPSCLSGAYEVCSVLCVFTFCFSPFTFSSDFKERSVVFSKGGDCGCSCRLWGCGYSSQGAQNSWCCHLTVYIQNWSVSKVLEATSWRLNSVFASFYLSDVQYVMEGLRSLGPIMAEGSVLPYTFLFWLFSACEHSGVCWVFRWVVNPTSLFLCFGWWGSGEFSFWDQMQISAILRCSILFPKGWWLPGFLNAIWVLVGWQCWLVCLPFPPYLPPVCLSLRLLVVWLVAPLTWLLMHWQWPLFTMVSSW